MDAPRELTTNLHQYPRCLRMLLMPCNTSKTRAAGADLLELSLHAGDRCRMRIVWRQDSIPSGGRPPYGHRVPRAPPLELCLQTDTDAARVPSGGGPPYRPCTERAPVRTVWRQSSVRVPYWRRVRILWSSHSMLPSYGHCFILNVAAK